MLKHLMAEIIDRCNYRCNMCTIWTHQGPELDLVLLEKFLKSPYCAGMESIGITGGEPMMFSKLSELAAILNKLDNIKTIYISSNGWFKDRLLKFVEEFPNKQVNVNISIDGLKEMHNQIRGIESFDRAVETLKELTVQKAVGELGIVYPSLQDNSHMNGTDFPKAPGKNRKGSTGIKMTVQRKNIGEILGLYKFAKSLKVYFSLMPVVSSPAYFNNVSEVDDISVNPGTSDGDRFLTVLKELHKHYRTPYIDMLMEMYSGKWRNMDIYRCLFPEENNMIYPDGTLGVCFLTDRLDVKAYLADFENYEKKNPEFRALAKTELLATDCKTCPASCAGNYKLSFLSELIGRIQNKILSLDQFS